MALHMKDGQQAQCKKDSQIVHRINLALLVQVCVAVVFLCSSVPVGANESRILVAQASEDEIKIKELVEKWAVLFNERKWDDYLALYTKDATTVYDSDNKKGNMEDYRKYLSTSARIRQAPPMKVSAPMITKIEGTSAKIKFEYRIGRITAWAFADLVKQEDGKWLIEDYKE